MYGAEIYLYIQANSFNQRKIIKNKLYSKFNNSLNTIESPDKLYLLKKSNYRYRQVKQILLQLNKIMIKRFNYIDGKINKINTVIIYSFQKIMSISRNICLFIKTNYFISE